MNTIHIMWILWTGWILWILWTLWIVYGFTIDIMWILWIAWIGSHGLVLDVFFSCLVFLEQDVLDSFDRTETCLL